MNSFEPGVFVFAIPLQSRIVSYDWDAVCERFAACIKSCVRQDADNVRVLVCCHEIPPNINSINLPSDRVMFVTSPLGPPVKGAQADYLRYDKFTKIKNIAVICGKMWSGHGHFMMLDADDIVGVDFVEKIRSTAPRAGVIMSRGYVYLLGDKKLYKIPGEGSDESFDQVCGSSGVLYLESGDFPESVIDCMPGAGKQNRDRFFNTVRGHKVWRDTFDYAGKPFVVSDYRDVIYSRDHGSNLSSLSDDGVMYRADGKILSGKPVALTKSQIEDEKIRERFGLEL